MNASDKQREAFSEANSGLRRKVGNSEKAQMRWLISMGSDAGHGVLAKRLAFCIAKNRSQSQKLPMTRPTLVALLVAGAFLICSQSTSFSQQGLNDATYRQRAAERIQRAHGIQFDWKTHSLLELHDYESRLSATQRIKRAHGVQFDWEKWSLLKLLDAEARMSAAQRIQRATGQSVDWQTYSLLQLMELEQTLRQTSQRTLSSLPTSAPAPLSRISSGRRYFGETPEDISSDAEDLSWQIRKLRRNASDYSADEYARKLKRLEGDLEDLSSRAQEVGADDASAHFDDASGDLRRVRRNVEWSDGYFYEERENDINRRLRRAESGTEDASWDLDR